MTKQTFMALGLAALTLVVGIGFAKMAVQKNDPSSQALTSRQLVGGSFSLLDHTGKRVSDKNYSGKYQLVYFGYTYCPEICPMSLQAIADAMELVGPLADEITPLFITVDPERDTPEQMASYVANFDKRTVGLTGTPEELKNAAKAYRVYYRQVIDKSTKAVDFDHSALTFLMDRQGKYLTHFAYGVQGDKIAEQLKKLVKKKPGPQQISKLMQEEAK